MLTNDLYFVNGLFNCFEGDDAGGDDAATAAAAAAVAADAVAAANAAASGKTFSQDEVNAIVAKEKRQNQAALLKTEATYKQMLAENQNLSAKDRTMLEENLATVQGQLRTKEEQAKIEKKQLEEQLTGKIKETEERASAWENRYRRETVSRSLQDAAVAADAFQPSQIVSLLQPMTRLVEEVDPKTGKSSGKFNSMIDFPDVDAEGNPCVSTLSPKDAVKRMKDLPETYGNLFKSGVVSGIGANSATGIAPGANGKLDLRKLDARTYREMREKNPEALGLRSRGPRR